MKLLHLNFLIIIFAFSIPICANTHEAFEKRIKLFGLDQQVDTIKQAPSRQSYEIVQTLKNELETSYLKSALKESKFGKCELGSYVDCLEKEKSFWRIKLDGRSRCYPSTMCGYYQCMESEYQCNQHGINYFTDLAFPTCTQYVKNINQGMFSKEGVEWIYSVMVCLQKGLFEECELTDSCNQDSEKKTCKHIVDFTLKFHPGCYINSGVGICNLKLKDQINIWRTVGPYLTKRERVEAFKVVRSCLQK